MGTPGQSRRRLTAILAADIAGYSRLMGVDEIGTACALREHRAAVDPIMASYGGRIVKTTGDGVLVEFPSIVAAVECAVAVQTRMAERNADLPEDRQMRFRIGINLGDVLIEGDDILGDGVNVAARLEGIAEPGGIYISDAAYHQVQDKISAEFVDMGEQNLKNIARPVRAFAIRCAGPRVSPDVTITAASVPKLSLVVLPFGNLGGGADQDYFVDGLTEDLTTELSRLPKSFVIACNTAFTFKGKPIDVKRIGRDLGVRYVLEGSVRKSGQRVRVNAQLIDAETGGHLWADRFDREVTDLFALQDAVTMELAGVFGGKTYRGREPPQQAQTESRCARPRCGSRSLNRGWSRENIAAADRLYDQALELDPDNMPALTGLATGLAIRVGQPVDRSTRGRPASGRGYWRHGPGRSIRTMLLAATPWDLCVECRTASTRRSANWRQRSGSIRICTLRTTRWGLRKPSSAGARRPCRTLRTRSASVHATRMLFIGYFGFGWDSISTRQ